MFEFLFKYPATAFSKGEIVFLGRWPLWLMALLLLSASAILAFLIWRRKGGRVVGLRSAGIWLLQTLMVSLLLLILWQPALSIATLRPQQNVVAVVVDDSRSMDISEEGSTRRDKAVRALESGLMKSLSDRFQVRLYRTGQRLERIEKPAELNASNPTTHLGEALKQVVAESATLPVGAVVLMSDGADNAGGIDLATLNDVRKQRLPVHTVGFGAEQMERDLEIGDVQLPRRTLADSRVTAAISFRQRGFASEKARITLKDGEKTLATHDVTLKADGVEQTEWVIFNAGAAGARAVQATVEPVGGETNRSNNSLVRLINVDATNPRILYIEGEPKWEYKFIRRAIELDKNLQLVSMLRTTQNKIYRQGIKEPKELEEGFPAKPEELFEYQGLIIGGVEASYFTATQQELIRQFADRRGGGVLFLGGRSGLAEGGYGKVMPELLPTALPDKKVTFIRDPAYVELTGAGRDHLMCRIEDNPERNAERWKKLPYVANYQDPGNPKPGAVVLAEMTTGNRRMPFLVTQNYGRGRTAILASSGTWRWQMQQPLEDMSHEMFWQQTLRWLVSGTQGRVITSTPKSVFSDETKIPLRAEVRDKSYAPVSDARVEAHILGPDGLNATVPLKLEPNADGVFAADWSAEKPGSYVVEIVSYRGEEELGRDVLTFRREDGVAENFHLQQNRELLEKLASQTGGKYYKPNDVDRLSREIAFSEAGITTRETRDLWDMPILFLAALLIRSSEWLLRRKWGVV